MLKSVLAPMRDSGARVLAGGDWNNPPNEMANWLSQNNMPYLVVAQTRDTFVSTAGRSNIDYFLASPEVAAAISVVEICELSGLTGHSPVALTWEAAILAEKVKVWQRPAVPPCTLVLGPHGMDDAADRRVGEIEPPTIRCAGPRHRIYA